MRINSSVEWDKVDTNLHRKARGLRHEKEIHRLINNLRSKITELSKAEVNARRGQYHRAIELLKEVNNDIETVEEFILVAALIG